MGSRTALPARAEALAALLIVAIAASCARPETAYRRALAVYQGGDLAEALAQTKANAARWPDPASRWYWDFRLLEAEALSALARYPEAGALLKDDPPARPELSAQHARLLIDRAILKLSRHEDATSLLRQARQLAADPDLMIRIELVDGSLELDQRRHERSQERFQAALDLAAKHRNLYLEATALNNLAVTSKRLNRYEESIDYGVAALAAAEKAGARRVAAMAHGNIGPSYAYLGQFEAALDHEQKAIRMNEAIGSRGAMMTAVGELGLIYDTADRVPEAIPQYRRAFELAGQLGATRDGARFAENLALALIKTSQWDAAAEWNDRAWDLAQQSRATANLPFLIRNRAQIAWRRGQADEAARLCRELLAANPEQPSITWEAHELLGEIDTAAKRYRDANRHFDTALRIIDGTRLDVLDSRNRVTLLSRLISFYRDYVEALILQGDDAGALRVAESSRARVLAERLGRDLKAGPLAAAGALPAFARASNIRLLSFWIAPHRSFAWLVAPNGVRRFDLPPSAELETLVTAYRDVVEHSIADPIADPAARALWDKLMAPIAAEIPKGARLIVVPDGPLHRLNLETLAAPGLQPHYWIEDVETAVSPSIAIAMSRAGAPRGDGSLLLIGAPDYAGTGYENLPGAAAEVRDLQARFAAIAPAVLTGANASPAGYRKAGPANFSVIHFAAHAEANLEKPLESAVVLARAGNSFKLYARDVIDIPIRADLVTLSACRSAGARAYAGEGLMGFAWAFLHSGARTVVAGLWDVSDGSTVPLMSKFYEGIAAKRETASALREAKLAMLREGRYRRAFYWGAFQAYVAAVAR